jgi:hypothetical protein
LKTALRLLEWDAKTFVVKKSSSNEYYGRLVYEDDVSGIDGSELASREIMINMPWQVVMEVDKDGYFKVVYSEEQFAELIKDNAKGTVILRQAGKRSSTANVKFTLDILSTDKVKAGVVKIPKP